MVWFGATDKGLAREENQDCFKCFEYADASVFVVCDGMGGTSYGSIASKKAVAAFYEKFCELSAAYSDNPVVYELSFMNILKKSASYANKTVYESSLELSVPHDMGTTFVCAAVYNGSLYILNVGDSRVYEYREGKVSILTKDHSYVGLLLELGKISKEDAYLYDNGAITRALGLEEDVEIDTYVTDFNEESVYMLCSDGLYNMIGEEIIKNGFELSLKNSEINEAVHYLISQANLCGGGDNITAVIIKA